MTQVSKDAYTFGAYSGVDRFVSYARQIEQILATQPSSVMEVGVGEAVTANYLRANTNISYTSVDYAEDLKPDVVADVRSLPFQDDAFDTVCAFEVLEHLPYDDFARAVRELARVARGHVLISLPHFGPPLKFLLKVPFLPELRFALKIPYPKTHVFNGQHYWEIGKHGYLPSRIREMLEEIGTIEEEFIPFENQYHHFFKIRL